MNRYFNTKEAAERFLEVRRKAAYKRIEKKGWKIMGDNSFVHQNAFDYCKHDTSTHKNKGKWFTFLAIVTDEMIKDLSNMKSFVEIQEEEQRLVNELQKIPREVISRIFDQTQSSSQNP
jgi:hypothetical protein